jgi:hypothetical protein
MDSTSDIFLKWIIWTLASVGVALLVLAALI